MQPPPPPPPPTIDRLAGYENVGHETELRNNYFIVYNYHLKA